MNKKRLYLAISVLCLTLIALLYMFLNSMFYATPVDDGNTGTLFGQREEETPPSYTVEEREEMHNSLTELTDDVILSMKTTITRLLSTGDFAELSGKITTWKETYKENDAEDVDWMWYLESYHSDVTQVILSQQSDTPSDSWLFFNPDSVAAAMVHLPISVKYQAILNQSSAIFPAPLSSDSSMVNLREADLSKKELAEILHSLNEQRTSDARFIALHIYEANIYGRPCYISVVGNADGYYEPLSIKVINDDTDQITVQFIKELAEAGADVDAVINVTPASR